MSERKLLPFSRAAGALAGIVTCALAAGGEAPWLSVTPPFAGPHERVTLTVHGPAGYRVAVGSSYASRTRTTGGPPGWRRRPRAAGCAPCSTEPGARPPSSGWRCSARTTGSSSTGSCGWSSTRGDLQPLSGVAGAREAGGRGVIRMSTTAVLVTVLLLLVMLPFLWLLQMSFKTNAQVFTFPPPLVFQPTLDNYASLWNSGFRTSFANSLVVGIASTVVSMAVGVPAAYALSRWTSRAGNAISLWILASRMAPPRPAACRAVVRASS